MTSDEFAEQVIDMLRETPLQAGEDWPDMLFLQRDGQLAGVAEFHPGCYHHGKLHEDAVASAAMNLHAERVALVNMGWLSEIANRELEAARDSGDRDYRFHADDRPDRVELLMVAVVDATSATGYTAKVIRDALGFASLGEFQSGPTRGRLVDPLRAAFVARTN